MTRTKPKQARPMSGTMPKSAAEVPPPLALERVETGSATGEGVQTRPTTSPATEVQVVVRVTEAHYVPAGLELRARISNVLFTAQLPAAGLDDLQRDPRVAAVGFPRAVHPEAG